jgi:hypothetical protein
MKKPSQHLIIAEVRRSITKVGIGAATRLAWMKWRGLGFEAVITGRVENGGVLVPEVAFNIFSDALPAAHEFPCCS